MEIESVYPPYIYSIKYDETQLNEFERLLEEWRDLDKSIDFFTHNQTYLQSEFWSHISDPEIAAEQVSEEADDLELLFYNLFQNTEKNQDPDFDSHFKFLEGKYKFEFEYVPFKSYGSNRPSLIRMYAIKMDSNKYIIVGGGIKLCKTIQESPYLQDHIIQNIDRVRLWLRQNGIDKNDEL